MKELTIETANEAGAWTSPLLNDPGTIIKTVNCRPHGPKRIVAYIEISSISHIKDVLRAISSEPDVSYSTFNVFDGYRASGIVVRKSFPVCRAVFASMGFCRQCPLSRRSGDEKSGRWQVLFSGKTASRKFLAELKREGVEATLTEFGTPTNNGILTFEQESALRLAHANGYFVFPRRTSLKALSSVLGISPSTLDEILRRAEGKVVEEYVGKPRERAARGSDRRSPT
ncbi:MAG: helix-turn-helix domain-containing protein [Nitrososphaerales archaeon]